MESNSLIGIYSSSRELIGYFHNEQEAKDYISFVNERKLSDTKGWTMSVENFIG
jgi:hypothetical protein